MMAAPSPLGRLLRAFSWPELRHHGLRHATAVLAVTLGVALAFSVQLINSSALSEFSSAVRSVNGQADLTLRAASGGFAEALYARVAATPRWRWPARWWRCAPARAGRARIRLRP